MTTNIDLGDLGSLMAPVKVGDKTYMVLSTTKGEKHDWDDYIRMREIQAVLRRRKSHRRKQHL